MSEEAAGGSVYDNAILLAFFGLIGHLETIGVTTRDDVADFLNIKAETHAGDLGPLLSSIAECIRPRPPQLRVID